jgi:hypothetical protein
MSTLILFRVYPLPTSTPHIIPQFRAAVSPQIWINMRRLDMDVVIRGFAGLAESPEINKPLTISSDFHIF